jgi:hypothetical protein
MFCVGECYNIGAKIRVDTALNLIYPRYVVAALRSGQRAP